MYLGLARTIALLLCYLLLARASNVREQTSEGLNTIQTEQRTTIIENLSDSGSSDDRTIFDDDAASKALSVKMSQRKKRGMKYSVSSGEQPMLTALRTYPSGRRPRGRIGKNPAWDSNMRASLIKSKSSRNTRAFGKSGNKRICYRQHGVAFCKRLRTAEMKNGKVRNLKSLEFTNNGSDNMLAREIYSSEVEALRKRLQSIRQERLEELLNSDDNQPAPGAEVQSVDALQNVEHKRNELSSLVDSDVPLESKARPRFYPNDGPKRDWKVNLMRVWG